MLRNSLKNTSPDKSGFLTQTFTAYLRVVFPSEFWNIAEQFMNLCHPELRISRSQAWIALFIGCLSSFLHAQLRESATGHPPPKAAFELRNSEDADKGWDDTGAEPWTAVGIGKTSSLLRVRIEVIEPDKFELVPDEQSKANLTVDVGEGIQTPITNFTITGTAASGARGAKIIFRRKGTTNAVATLHVHVLPSRVIHFSVYHASDEGPGRVPLSALPPGVPSPAKIEAELNETFSSQTNIRFIANTKSNPLILSKCDGSFVLKDGACYYGSVGAGHGGIKVQDSIVTNHLYPEAAKAGISGTQYFLNFIVVKNVIKHDPLTRVNKDVKGLALIGEHFPFIDADALLPTYAHEAGHCLRLSTRNDAGDDNGHHDNGMGSDKKRPLMFPTNMNRGRWIRQEDWRQANDHAGSKFH
jgi:hypothetical protein